MKMTLHKAFDLVAAHATYTKGEIINNDPLVDGVFVVDDNSPFVWMYMSGRQIFVNTKTGEQIERVAGDNLIRNPIPPGEWRSIVPEDFDVVCFSPVTNNKKVPLADHITFVSIPAGEQYAIPHLTKLFLAKGSVTIDGQTVSGPKQISFKTGDKSITSTTGAYGVIIN